MKVTSVKILPADRPGELVRAYCAVVFDDVFVVENLKVIESAGKRFVSFPARKQTARCASCGTKNHLKAAYCNGCGVRLPRVDIEAFLAAGGKLYLDQAHPLTQEFRGEVVEAVLRAYDETRARGGAA